MIIRRNWPTAPLWRPSGRLRCSRSRVGDGGNARHAHRRPWRPSHRRQHRRPRAGGRGLRAATSARATPTPPASKHDLRALGVRRGGHRHAVAEQPELFDLNVEAGRRHPSVPGPRQGRLSRRRSWDAARDWGSAPGAAHYDYEIVQVKQHNDLSEDFDIYSSDGFIRRGGATYRESCTPAAFPLPRPADAPPQGAGCGWPYPPPGQPLQRQGSLPSGDFDTLDSTPLVGHDVAVLCERSATRTAGASAPSARRVTPSGRPVRSGRSGRAEDTGRVGPTWTNPEGHYCTGPESGCQNARTTSTCSGRTARVATRRAPRTGPAGSSTSTGRATDARVRPGRSGGTGHRRVTAPTGPSGR